MKRRPGFVGPLLLIVIGFIYCATNWDYLTGCHGVHYGIIGL